MGEERHKVYLGLGSNLGDREAHIQKTVALIDERVGSVIRQSSLIETEPWGFESDNRFLNAVILCETTLTPREVLQATQQIERDMGRKNKSVVYSQKSTVYHDRPIDIDILLYDDITISEPDLKIPHPLMYERDFVMRPLREIREET
ncbi:MAG: 2-amino-4-hydroxy-6-hydroxymethyldihydropteridine diphosphokinase [Prevotella sp.]|nr:2-amino-4-hydroxy-6-hydroxymethyldihydropteridine diphosphokinase [Prevotella sp.]